MISSETDRSKILPRLKESYSVGNLILNNKRKLYKLKEKQNATFIKAIGTLEKSLKKSESLMNMPFLIKKNNSVMKIFKMKEEHMNKNKNKFSLFPNINQNNKQNLDLNSSNHKILDSNNPININKKNINSKTTEASKIPYYLKALSFPTKVMPSSQIVKISRNQIYGRNPFKKYCYNLEENVDDYVTNQEKNSEYNNFHAILKGYIKDESSGITIPGNLLNRNTIGFMKTIHPKNVRTRIKKRIDVPDKTLVPLPRDLVGKGIIFSHITMKDLYNEKNRLL